MTKSMVDSKNAWMAGGPLALMLRVRHQDISAQAKKGTVARVPRRVSHAQKAPSWYYNVPDAIRVFGLPKTRRPSVDCTGGYVRDADAAFLLNCSNNTIVNLSDKGRIKRIKTRFKYPIEKVTWGYRLKDIMTLKRLQNETSALVAYEEETVKTSRVVRRLVKEVTVGEQVTFLANRVRNGEITKEEFADEALKLAA